MIEFEHINDTAMLSQILVAFMIVINLMKLEHPESRPFYREICETNQLAMNTSQCMSQVLISIQDYAKAAEQTTISKKPVVETLLDRMLLNTKLEPKNIDQTHDNIIKTCLMDEEQKLCKIWLNSLFERISTFLPEVGSNKLNHRVKRSGCTPEELFEASNRNSLNLFRQKHGIADDTFNRISQEGLHKSGNAQELLDFRPGVTNHILKATDADTIFQMSNGQFPNLKYLGQGLDKNGEILHIYKTKKNYSFFFARSDGIVHAGHPDKIVVSVTDDFGIGNHHMIGNLKNSKQVIDNLKNGNYVQYGNKIQDFFCIHIVFNV